MYKILIKYTSTSNKIFWQSYEITDENGNTVEFVTDNFAVLKEEMNMLISKYGFENIRIINDVTYSITVNVVDDIENVQISTSEDVTNIYNTAFANVFGNTGDNG